MIPGCTLHLTAAPVCRDQQFELKADYSADSPVPQGFDAAVGKFIIGPAKATASGEKPKLKVSRQQQYCICFRQLGSMQAVSNTIEYSI